MLAQIVFRAFASRELIARQSGDGPLLIKRVQGGSDGFRKHVSAKGWPTSLFGKKQR